MLSDTWWGIVHVSDGSRAVSQTDNGAFLGERLLRHAVKRPARTGDKEVRLGKTCARLRRVWVEFCGVWLWDCPCKATKLTDDIFLRTFDWKSFQVPCALSCSCSVSCVRVGFKNMWTSV